MKGTKILAGFLSAAMVFGTMAFPAFADDSTVSTEATSLPDAVDGVITLTDDVKADITIASDQSLTIDLNGHKITNASGKHTIINSGNLTITDSSADKSGVVDNTTHARAALHNEKNATATLSGGTFMRSGEDGKNNSFYTVSNLGTMTINNGVTVENNGNYSSNVVSGYYTGTPSGAVRLTINGGTFIGGVSNVKNEDSGILEINGGSFTGAPYGVLNWNIAVINDGTFEGIHADILNVKYYFDNGAPYENAIGKLEINGGKYLGNTFDGIAAGMEKYACKDISISGGTYTTDVSEYCKDGYAAEKDETTGEYVVKKTLAWETDTDSGSYVLGDKKYGMMRFMFKTAPEGEVTASGIKYINASDIAAVPTVDGAVNTTNHSSVFQGDIVKVPEGKTGTYYAKAYVTTAEGTFWSEAVGCSVNWDRFFADYKEGQE